MRQKHLVNLRALQRFNILKKNFIFFYGQIPFYKPHKNTCFNKLFCANLFAEFLLIGLNNAKIFYALEIFLFGQYCMKMALKQLKIFAKVYLQINSLTYLVIYGKLYDEGASVKCN